ncbi:hypothetical protein N0Y54_14730 [Nostoc punctiforme UO1]|uniref:hypothetical protein n=1 Tax=Nostoc punctiforme TaxID=272131 RepID=UPI0030A7A7A1
MKFKSVSIGIGLSILSFSVSSFPRTVFNSPRVLAQEVSSSCPLPSDIAVTFLNSKCEEVKLEEPKTFYRYYSSSENRYGRYLTTDKYETNVEVIRNLALNQSWGNKATMIQPVTLPGGTTVYQGIVAPQAPTQCYPGGGQQTFIKDTRDPNIKWSEGQNIIEKDFSCP